MFTTPINSNIFCNIGSLLILVMLLEFFTGILLSFKINGYNSGVIAKLEFLNNTFIGWFIFKVHIMLPNFIAFLILLHMFKCFLNPMNSSKEVIISGFLLLILFVGVSYTGYSLSKGSMGYWAVVVVNSLLKEILGIKLSSSLFFHTFIGFSSDVFFKIFTYHFLLSFFIIFFQFIHIFFLHFSGSSNFVNSLYLGYNRFNIFTLTKDILLIIFMLLNIFYFIFFSFLDINGENFLQIDEFKALELSVEWYVRMFFIVLRGVCLKIYGILFTLVLLLSILLNFFIKDLFRLNTFKSINFYIILFIINVFFIYMSYLGFSSYLLLISFTLLLFLTIILDCFITKLFLHVFKI